MAEKKQAKPLRTRIGTPMSQIDRLVFRGKNTAHRVIPVQGDRERIIAVFSYYERPDVTFTEADRIGFYGRAA